MSYEFSKVYGDLVTDDGTVITLYFAWAYLLGDWVARGSCDVYRSDGQHLTIRDLTAPSRAVFDEPASPVVLRGSCADGEVVLRLSPEHGVFAPRSPLPSLRWSVLVARGVATAHVPGLGEISGTGYVDRLDLARPTRLLHLKTLHWGRAHAGAITAVYTVLDFGDGQRWSTGEHWRGQERFEPAAVDVSVDEDGRGSAWFGEHGIVFESPRMLQGGSAFAADRMSGAVDRVVARAVGGRTMQTRWLARARATGADAVGWAIHEKVVFG